MSDFCPNYSDPKFKEIIAALGNDPVRATQYYHNYNGDIDTLHADLLAPDVEVESTPEVNPLVAGLYKNVDYTSVTPSSRFEGKSKILADLGIKTISTKVVGTTKQATRFYYVLNKTQQDSVAKYKARGAKDIGFSTEGFDIVGGNSSVPNLNYTLTYKIIGGKGYIYATLNKQVKDSEGIILYKPYGHMRFSVDLVYHGEEKTYTDNVKKNTLYIPEIEADIRKYLFKTRNISDKKIGSFHVFNLKYKLLNFINTELGTDYNLDRLNSLSESAQDEIITKLSVKYKDFKEHTIAAYKQYFNTISVENLRDEIYAGIVLNRETPWSETELKGLRDFLEYLPASFLKLVAFETIDARTAFFANKHADTALANTLRSQEVSDASLRLKMLQSDINVYQTYTSNLIVKKLLERSIITSEFVDKLNARVKDEIETQSRNYRGPKSKKPPYYIQKASILKKQLNRAGIPKEVYDIYRDEVLYELNTDVDIRLRSFSTLLNFIRPLEIGQFLRVPSPFSKIGIGDFTQNDSYSSYAVDHTVIVGHETGHALDYYLMVAKPDTRAFLMDFIKQLATLPEFQNYIETGLNSRNYTKTDAEEIAADLYAYSVLKAINYDVSNSHLAALTPFFEQHGELVNKLWIEQTKDKLSFSADVVTTTTPGEIPFFKWLRSVINDVIDALNKIIGKNYFNHVTASSKGITVTTEKEIYPMSEFIEDIKDIVLSESNFDIDVLLNSETLGHNVSRHIVNPKEAEFKKLVKLNSKEVSNRQAAAVNSRVKTANGKLGTSFFVKFSPVGQADILTWVILDKAKGSANDSTTKENSGVQTGPSEQTSLFYRDKPVNDPTYDDPDTLTGAGLRLEPVLTQTLNGVADDSTYAQSQIKELAARLSNQFGNIPYEFITAEQATQIIPNYKNEPAAFFNGTVYFIGDRINSLITFHEFSHPFIKAIKEYNKPLFLGLYEKLMETAEGEGIYKKLLSEYADLPEGSDLFMEEALAQAMGTKFRLDNMKITPTSGFMKWINDMMYAIKQMLRKFFGKKIDISNLDVGTSLQTLVDMIEKGGEFFIEKSMITDAQVASYYRDNKELLESLKNLDNIEQNAVLKRIHELTSNHIKLLQNNNRYEDLLDLLKDRFGALELETIQKDVTRFAKQIIKKGDELIEESAVVNARAQTLVDTIYRLNIIMAKFDEHMDDLIQDLDNKANGVKAFYYRQFVDNYDEFVTMLKTTMEDKIAPDSFLRAQVNTLGDRIKDIQRKTQKFYSHGASDIIYQEVGHMADAIDQKYQTIIDGIIAKGKRLNQDPTKYVNAYFKEWKGMTQQEYAIYEDLKARDPKLSSDEANTLRVLQAKLFNGKQITKDKIDLAIKGIGPDANAFSSFLEGYLYNPDIVVGGLALYVKNAMTDVLVTAQGKMNDFFKEVYPLMEAAGYDPNKVDELAKKLLRVQEYGRPNQVGEFEIKEVYTFISAHKDYRVAKDKLANAVKLAEETYAKNGTDENKRALTLATKAREDFQRRFMHNKYHPDFYRRYDLFDNSNPIHVEAWRRYTEIVEALDNYNRTLYSESLYMESLDQRKEIWIKYGQLFSTYDNGVKKTGDELAIAQILRKFRDMTREFYTNDEIPGSFQNALHKFQQELIDKGITASSGVFQQETDAWIEANTSVKIKESYFAKRKLLINRFKEITSRLNQSSRDKIDIGQLYDELNDIVSPYRNNNRQISGIEMSDTERKAVKDIEEQLIIKKKNLRKLSGLTEAEGAQLDQLIVRATQLRGTGTSFTADEQNLFDALLAKMNAGSLKSLGGEVQQELYNIFRLLGEMSTRMATEDYCVELNDLLSDPGIRDYLSAAGKMAQYKPNNIAALTTYAVGDPLLSELFRLSPAFQSWWEKNHIIKEKFIDGVSHIEYERIFVWNVTMPSDPNDIESTEIEDITGEKYTRERVPSLRFFKRSVKEEVSRSDVQGNITTIKMRTPRVVGVTIDNQGQWLPRTDVPNSPYIDEEYFRLLNSTDPNDQKVFALLEAMKKVHLANQEGLGYRSKLYLDIPRFRQENIELLRSKHRLRGQVKAATGQTPEPDKPMSFIDVIIFRFKEFFNGVKDAAELDGTGAQMNFKDEMQLVRTDIFNNEISGIPISGLFDLPLGEVSLDISKSMMRYMLSAERQKKLIEINPGAKMLQETVRLNNPKAGNKFSRWDFVHRGVLSPIKAEELSIRGRAVDNLIEREFESRTNAGITAESAWLNNTANLLFKRASFGFFAFNIPSALKNMFGPKVQGMIQAAGGKYVDHSSLIAGEQWSFATMGQLSFEIYKPKAHSINLQLMEIMDVIPDRFKQKFGERLSRTIARDTVGKDGINFGWLYNFRKWTESQSTLALAGAMMHKQMVETTDGSKMRFIDAWELRDDKIQLKANVNPEWGITYDKDGKMLVGSKFKFFKNRTQQAGTLLQGSYAEFEQPEAHRYLAWRFITYLRRYFTSMLMNRWGFSGELHMRTLGNDLANIAPRSNYGLGDTHMGYYVSFLRTLIRTVKDLRYAHYLTPEEKGDVLKFVSEIAILMTIMAVFVPLLGWDPDDEEKYEKLKEKSGPMPILGVTEDPRYPFKPIGFMENHLLLLLMQIRSENEQFLPFPNWGADDYISMLNLKSIAIDPTLKTLEDALTSMYNAAIGNDAAYYQRAVGPYDWQQQESLKVWNYTLKSFGITGTAASPEQAIKNLQGVKSR